MNSTLRLVELPVPALRALADGDLATADRMAGIPLTEYFILPEHRALWRMRLEQIEADPEVVHWAARAAMVDGRVVGLAGFHAPPDADGRVEVSYSVDPAHRRRGYARAMLRALLDRAAEEPGVRVVRAAISPGNEGSLATIEGHGFTHVGEQWDEEDGRELLFEVEVPDGRTPAAQAR